MYPRTLYPARLYPPRLYPPGGGAVPATVTEAYRVTRYSGARFRLTRYGMDDTYLFLDNDHEIDWFLELKDASTRAWAGKAGLTSLSGFIAATPTGSAIGSASVTLDESALAGRYYGVIDLATVNADLAAYENQHVYEIITDGANIRAVYKLVVKRRVVN